MRTKPEHILIYVSFLLFYLYKSPKYFSKINTQFIKYMYQFFFKYIFCLTFFYICYTMLLKTSQNPKETYKTIHSIAGSSLSVIEKFKLNVFGSPKYRIINILPKHDDVDFEEYTDLVYGVFELRKRGLAFFFRFKNEEYVIVSLYNQLSFTNNDNLLDFQFSSFSLKLRYEDLKSHKKFISRFFKMRNMYLNDLNKF